MPTHAEIVDVLYREVQTATKGLAEARRRFDEIINDIPSGIPQPDGQFRIRAAGAQLRMAQDAMYRAITRYSAWTLNGTVPEDLKIRPVAKSGAGL